MSRSNGPSLLAMSLTLLGVVVLVTAAFFGVSALAARLAGPAPIPAPSGPTPASAARLTTGSASTGATDTAPVHVTLSAPAAAVKPKAPTTRPAATTRSPVVPATIPEKMARTLYGSTQMVLAVGQDEGATHGTLYVFDKRGPRWVSVLQAPCRFGTYGLHDGLTRVEDSRMTPTGIWDMGSFVFGQHDQPPAGTRMPYRHITADVYWSKQRDATYNTWVSSSSHVSGEHLIGVPIQYEYALSTGYNAPPNQVVQGRGTAIFLHIFDPPDYNNGLSAGCVAVSRGDIIRVFQTLDPARRPSFAIGTLTPGSPISIWSY